MRLVGQKGPRGFSLNEASRLAGVTVGAPYRHFADKDALLAEIACDGNEMMDREVREAISNVKGVKQQMIEAGMAYLRFSRLHFDYFSVIFNAGLDKYKYPDLARSSWDAFSTVWELAHQLEETPESARKRAITAWALVHGLATLSREGSLSLVLPDTPDFEHLRPVLEQFVNQPASQN